MGRKEQLWLPVRGLECHDLPITVSRNVGVRESIAGKALAKHRDSDLSRAFLQGLS